MMLDIKFVVDLSSNVKRSTNRKWLRAAVV
jgi:hypothetical protein